jgi:hypothetical protein
MLDPAVGGIGTRPTSSGLSIQNRYQVPFASPGKRSDIMRREFSASACDHHSFVSRMFLYFTSIIFLARVNDPAASL